MMQATVITVSNPFAPHAHRTVATVGRRRRLRALAPKTNLPFICLLNGKPVLRHTWNRKVRHGDHVAFVTLVQGGGGDGGSNPIATVMMLALVISAQPLGVWGASMMGLGQGAVAFVSAGIVMTGSMLINSMLPKPSAPTPQTAAALSSPSPTYSLGAQGNTARVDQPIPVIYGRHIVYPDFAGQPYAEFSGNEQFLYQLFCIGQGEYTIEQIRIEDTVIANFEEITYEIVAPGGTVTLFPSNVTNSAEVSGQELLTSTVVGPFTANAAGSLINYIGIDLIMPRGLYYAESTGALSQKSVVVKVEARLIDNSGSPLGSWTTLATETYSAASTTPQRASYKYSVTSGRYEVRLTRTDTKDTSTQAGHEVDWGGMRAYFPGSQSYGNVTILAMRMKATNNLSGQASRKVNCIVTRKLPVWNGSSWSAATETRSIAWALADICRADYGAGLADSRIDLDGLLALDAVWAARGDYFDAVSDSSVTIWEALTQCARAGRAVPVQQGGVLYFVRDQASTTPVALFSQRNIVKNSLKLDYTLPGEDVHDAVDISYFDNATWQTKTVRAAVDTETNPAKLSIYGVTDRAHAWREGAYMSADNKYRRRRVTFQTEMEGFILTYGDPIAIQHDMPQWGQCGEVESWNASTLIVTCSQPPDFSAGGTHYIAFRRRGGGVDGPYAVTAVGGQPYQLQLATTPSVTPYTGQAEERTHYAFGPADAQYITARVRKINPRSDRIVELIGVIESDYVHTADTGTAPTDSAWQLPTRVTKPELLGLVVRSDPDTATYMFLSWQPSPGATHYLVEVSDSGDGWTRIGEPSATNFTAVASYGARTMIRVCAVGLARGDWVEINYGSSAAYMWDAVDTTLMWNATTSTLMWRY